ncbi:MAG: M20/M25/M40 family metallo-hydrolase [Pyrinomonadaceae bacterium]
MNPFELTRKLIDIPSISGDEAGIGRFLVTYLESLDYRVERQEMSNGRANIIATTGISPHVVFSTHMDTVPPHIASSEDADNIYGRGACDTKGIIAAQIAAAETLRAAGLTNIGLLFTVEEETNSAGARLANTHPLASECLYMINGEPTENKLATGSKGSLRLVLKTEGRAAHSAYPEQGESAIEKLLDILADVRAIHWPRDEFFGDTTCNIGVIRGGTRSNIVPPDAEADLHIRLVANSAQVKEMLDSVVGQRARIEHLSVAEPVRMLAVEDFAQEVVRFTTDIPHLTNWGTPLLLGPGSILNAHTPHEYIGKHEITKAIELYTRLARTLLARANDKAPRAENTPEETLDTAASQTKGARH